MGKRVRAREQETGIFCGRVRRKWRLVNKSDGWGNRRAWWGSERMFIAQETIFISHSDLHQGYIKSINRVWSGEAAKLGASAGLSRSHEESRRDPPRLSISNGPRGDLSGWSALTRASLLPQRINLHFMARAGHFPRDIYICTGRSCLPNNCRLSHTHATRHRSPPLCTPATKISSDKRPENSAASVGTAEEKAQTRPTSTAVVIPRRDWPIVYSRLFTFAIFVDRGATERGWAESRAVTIASDNDTRKYLLKRTQWRKGRMSVRPRFSNYDWSSESVCGLYWIVATWNLF